MRSCSIHFPGILVRVTASHNGFICLIAYDQRMYLVIRTEEVPCTTERLLKRVIGSKGADVPMPMLASLIDTPRFSPVSFYNQSKARGV